MDEEIQEYIRDMRISLNRSEHLCYVSLKYTRTIDVMNNVIERYVEALKSGAEGLYEVLSKNEDPYTKAKYLIGKINYVINNTDNEYVKEAMDLLLFFRKVLRAENGRCEEFRKNVTLTVEVEGEEYNIKIDGLLDYYYKIKTYVGEIERIIKEKEDGEQEEA